tara:strand:+ start:245 stop:400 length:156 start_codon:yes stop_codon:yes gene_type:complete
LLNKKADLFGFGVMGILCHRHKQNDPENTKGDAFLHPLFHVPVLGPIPPIT